LALFGEEFQSDALSKLKPRSVTQLSVIVLLAISKKYTVSGVTFSFKDYSLSIQAAKGGEERNDNGLLRTICDLPGKNVH